LNSTSFLLNVSLSVEVNPLSVIISIVILIVLLGASALISGSEVAFFSLKPKDIEGLENETDKQAVTILELLDKPKDLLATILIANNFINVSIIILSTYLSTQLLNGWEYKMVFDIIVITFILLLFGEVIPKVYASKNGLKMTKIMSGPLKKTGNVFPINILRKGLVSGTSLISNLNKKKSIDVSSDDLEHAIKLTKEESEGENESHKILEGIVKFGSKDVKQIMKARTDVVAFDDKMSYKDLCCEIIKNGYSRIPIYKKNFDEIVGILYVKDLIPYIDEQEGFEWGKLMRAPFFVPESKMIDDLLKNFQEKKMHMAIVVDEFGGTSGVVTLEDVLEEIVGDISDEFDIEDLQYSKLNDFTYVFEGKTPLIDFYKVIDIDGKIFEEVKGESDSIAGFIIEQAGKLLLKGEKVVFEEYSFSVESADERKIKRIKVVIVPKNKKNEE